MRRRDAAGRAPAEPRRLLHASAPAPRRVARPRRRRQPAGVGCIVLPFIRSYPGRGVPAASTQRKVHVQRVKCAQALGWARQARAELHAAVQHVVAEDLSEGDRGV